MSENAGGGDSGVDFAKQERWSGRELPIEVRRVLEACVESRQHELMQKGVNGGGGGGGDGFNEPSTPASRVVLYNGTNAEDRMDVTRVGLRAAENYQVSRNACHACQSHAWYSYE